MSDKIVKITETSHFFTLYFSILQHKYHDNLNVERVMYLSECLSAKQTAVNLCCSCSSSKGSDWST